MYVLERARTVDGRTPALSLEANQQNAFPRLTGGPNET